MKLEYLSHTIASKFFSLFIYYIFNNIYLCILRFISAESHKYNKKPRKGQYYLRALNETINLLECDISYNKNEGLLVREIEPFSSQIGLFNKSHIHIVVNNSIIADNEKIINHYSKYVNKNIDIYVDHNTYFSIKS